MAFSFPQYNTYRSPEYLNKNSLDGSFDELSLPLGLHEDISPAPSSSRLLSSGSSTPSVPSDPYYQQGQDRDNTLLMQQEHNTMVRQNFDIHQLINAIIHRGMDF
jgi:hypothetical protein